MLSNNEHFNISWNTFHDDLKLMLQEMHNNNDSKDVTLVCDDKVKVLAHRNVLTAFSPVFKEILTDKSIQCIYLKGIGHKQIAQILQFLYFGTVAIAKQDLTDLLKAATYLEIKELGSTEKKPFINDKHVETTNAITNHKISNKEHQEDQYKLVIKDIQEELNSTLEEEVNTGAESFENSSDNNSHTESLRDNKSKQLHACSECDSSFPSWQSLYNHGKSNHPGCQLPCRNSSCDFKASTLHYLDKHMRMVHHGHSYKCDQCDATFIDKRAMRNHKGYKHEGIRWPCNICSYKATTKRHLDVHVDKVHLGLNKIKCKQCDFKTNGYGKLDSHMMKFHNAEMFKCNFCELQSTAKAIIVRHIDAIHNEVKYPCDQCDYQATQPSSLKLHIQSIHEGFKYQCHQCDHQASQLGSLKSHLKTKHDII